MSRSGYSDDYDHDDLSLGRWRGMVASAIRGKRGQVFLRDLVAALDAMPTKRLIVGDLIKDGAVCAIGSLGMLRGVDMQKLDPEDPAQVGAAFNIARPLAAEVVFMNDEFYDEATPERRWQMMREWASSQIKAATSP